MNYENILSHFQVVKRYGDKSQALCPAHGDKQASLTITKGKECTLLHCHAGCSYEAIIQSIGLKKQDLFYEDKPSNSNWRIYIESREQHRIEAVYNYVSLNGNYAFTKVRMQGKKMIYGTLANERFTYGLGGRTRKELCAVYAPDGVQAINKAISESKPIFYVEGEKDVNTLKSKGYIAITAGGVNDWQSDFAQLFKEANVFILADNDTPGKNLANRVQADLQGIAKSAKVIIPVPDIPKGDISDFFSNGGTIQQLEEMITETPAWGRKEPLQEESTNTSEVKTMLFYDERGKILQTIKNFEVVLDNDKRFSGKIGFDEFSRQISLKGSVPWDISANKFRAWSNHDDSALFSILQSDYGLRSRNDFFDAVKIVAARNCFHPVRNMLESLPWKGDGYIRKLLPEYLGVEDTEYQYQVMKLWMLGAVSRIYSPGCKFDYTIILEGPQGIGKSTFLRLLALNDDWFNDSLDNLDSDKAAQSLMGSWIIELSELKSLARTSGGVDSIKRFLTAQQDKFRAPYERRAETIQRQSAFAGTTNRSDFLQDESGNRRFLIIETGVNKPTKSLFAPEAMDDIKGAWAEAVHIMKSENPKLVLPEECREQAEKLQAASMADDGKSGLIQAYLENKQRTCAIEIWQEALNESGRPAKWQASEINNIVSNLDGWTRMTSPAKFERYGSQRGFQKCSNKLLQSNDVGDGFMKTDGFQQAELPFE